MSGTMIAQVISLVSLIALQRWFYGPEEFGQFKLFLEFVTIFSSIASLKLENAIVLEQAPNVVKRLIQITTTLTVLSSVLSFIVFFISTYFSTQLGLLSETFSTWFFVPIAVFLIGIFQIFTLYFTKVSKFNTISSTKVIQSISTASGQIILGFVSGSFIGLVAGRIFGALIVVITYLGIYKKEKNYTKASSEEIPTKAIIKKHKDFILYTTPGVFVSGVINFLTVYIFIKKFGDTIGGEIAAAHHYLLLLIAVFSTSFAQVFYSKIAQIQKAEELKTMYFYWLKRLFILSIISLIVLYLIPNHWITLILSEKWAALFAYVKIAMLWSFTMLIASSLSYIFIKVKKQYFTFILDILHLIMVIGVFFFFNSSTENFNPEKALWLFTITQIFFYLLALVASIYAVYSYKEIDNKDIV